MPRNHPQENALFIKLVAYLLNDDASFRDTLRDEIRASWDTADFLYLHTLARFHDMASVLPLAAKLLALSLPESLAAALELTHQKAIYKCTVQDMLYDTLSGILEQNKVRHLPLKGLIMRKMYPYAELRTSGDADVVYDKACVNLGEYMSLCGFSLTKHSDIVDTYKSTGGAVFEMHREVSDDFTVHTALASNLWSAALLCDGKAYEHRLTNEDFYIYHIAHLAKHFTGKGSGIRPFADIFVFLKANGDTLDREKVQQGLEELGLVTFEKVMRDVAYYFFCGKDADALVLECAENVLLSGVYGNMKEMAVLDGVKKSEGKGGGANRQVKSFFLPLDRMKVKYPVLCKAPFLLPVFWGVRGVKAVFTNAGFYKKMAENYAAVDPNEVHKKRELFENLGLSQK